MGTPRTVFRLRSQKETSNCYFPTESKTSSKFCIICHSKTKSCVTSADFKSRTGQIALHKASLSLFMKYAGQMRKHNLDTEFWCGKTNCNVTIWKQHADTHLTVNECKLIQTDLNTSESCPMAQLQINTAPNWDFRERN
jgi:hypothetical protein